MTSSRSSASSRAASRHDSSGIVAWRLVMGVAVAVPLGFLVVFFAWPALTLIAYGLGGAGEGGVDLAGLGHVLGAARTWRVAWMSIWMAAAGTAGSAVIGTALAYVLYRLRFPGRLAARAFFSIPFVLPTVAVSAGFRSLFDRDGTLGFLGLDQTPAAVIIAMIFFNISLVARVVGSTWAHIDPAPEEAARMLGASPLRAWWDVTRPRLMPSLASVSSIVFLYCATAYSLVLILGGRKVSTIETEIYRETTQVFDLRAAAVLSLLQLVVVVGALLVARRAGMRGQAETGQVTRAVDRPVRGRDVWVLVLVGGGAALLTLAPLYEVIVRSLQRDGQWTLANYRDLANDQATPALATSVLAALGLSARTAVFAATFSLIIGCAIALVLGQRPQTRWARRAQSVFDSFVMLPLGVSAVTVGFGFLLTMSKPPLDLAASGWLVPAAQATVAVPLVVRIVVPTVRSIDPRLREAARMLGSSPVQVLAHIDGRFLARPAAIGWGFAFAISMGEFGATSFLVRPLTPTLPVVIYQLSGRPGAVEQGLAMSAAVLLSLVTAVVMIVVEHARERS